MKLDTINKANKLLERIKTLRAYILILKSKEDYFVVKTSFEYFGRKNTDELAINPYDKKSNDLLFEGDSGDVHFLIRQTEKRIDFLQKQIELL